MTICVGKTIIQILAKQGQWQSEDGEALIAASELFHDDPYAEIERLRAERDFARDAVVQKCRQYDTDMETMQVALNSEIADKAELAAALEELRKLWRASF